MQVLSLLAGEQVGHARQVDGGVGVDKPVRTAGLFEVCGQGGGGTLQAVRGPFQSGGQVVGVDAVGLEGSDLGHRQQRLVGAGEQQGRDRGGAQRVGQAHGDRVHGARGEGHGGKAGPRTAGEVVGHVEQRRAGQEAGLGAAHAGHGVRGRQ
ncbi:hypothetical protein ABT389_34440 [Streptomyces bacillaris]|uniref:hypothetical protein n=1 Tax=Streptomyces TaxID=1883 RepID=UPI0030D02E5F